MKRPILSRKACIVTAALAASVAALHASAQMLKLSGTSVTGGNTTGFAVTATNSSVAFRSNREDATKFELWRSTLSAPAPVKLSGTMVSGGAVRPDFKISGDNTRAVFRADRVAVGDIELWSAPMSGAVSIPTDVSELPAGRTVYDNFAVTSGAGTQRVVFLSNRDTASVRDLWVANTDGSGSPIKLSAIVTNATRDVQAFALSPTNSKVAFNGDLGVDGRDALYVADIAGGTPTLLYAPAAGENVLNSIQFSNDGTLIVFRIDRGAAGIELVRVPTAGGAVVSLSGAVTGGRSVRAFQLDDQSSASAQKVVFRGDLTTTGKNDLYSVDLDAVVPVAINLSAPLALSDGVASFKLSSQLDKVAFATEDVMTRRRLWATNVITSGLAAMPLDMSGPLVAGGDVSAYEISSNGGAVVFVANKISASVRELWTAAVDGSSAAQKLSGTLVGGGNVSDDFLLVNTGSTYTAFYRADAAQDEKTELWRALVTTGTAQAPVKLSGMSPGFADVASFFANNARAYFISNREVSSQQELFTQTIRQATTLDIDANGQVGALSDGLMITRFLNGSRDTAVTTTAYGQGAIRSTLDVDTYLFRLLTSAGP